MNIVDRTFFTKFVKLIRTLRVVNCNATAFEVFTSVGVVTLALKILLKLDIIFVVVPVYGRYKLFSKNQNSAAAYFVYLSSKY